MEMLRRIFGAGPARRQPRPDIVQMEGPDARFVYRETVNPVAIAARENFAMLYGRDNLPPHMAMDGVIEVRGPQGNWTPVTGSTGFNLGMEAQVAALQSFRETGIIGPQAVNTSGSMMIDQAVLAGDAAVRGSGAVTGPQDLTPEQIKAEQKGSNSTTADKAAALALENKSVVSPDEAKLLAQLTAVPGPERQRNAPGADRLLEMMLTGIEQRMLEGLDQQIADRKTGQKNTPDQPAQPAQPQQTPDRRPRNQTRLVDEDGTGGQIIQRDRAVQGRPDRIAPHPLAVGSGPIMRMF